MGKIKEIGMKDQQRVECVEKKVNDVIDKLDTRAYRIETCMYSIKETRQVIRGAIEECFSKPQTPYRCPVCGGNGLVPNGFYLQTSGAWTTSSAAPEQCRSCGGTGIVWG